MIRTLLFDFGDVFLELDKKAPMRALREEKRHPPLLKSLDPFHHQYERGEISSEQFFKHYQQVFPSLTLKAFKKIWNSMLIRLPQHRLEFLKQLAREEHYQLILLSNTNAWHIEWVRENIPTFPVFKDCFDAFYLSHEIGMRKPNSNIYDFVLQKHNLKAEVVLFIDDTQANTDEGQKLGLHTWNLNTDQDEVTELFAKNSALF